MSLSIITALSRYFGANPAFVLAGGGNTSFKDENYLYVKPSGVRLADIKETDFVQMDRRLLRQCFEVKDFKDTTDREARVKKMMEYAVCPGVSGRPSVEAPLHELMPFTYVVHLHPAMVNGMTCSVDGVKACAKLFPDALWVDYVDPGFTLAKAVYDANAAYQKKHGKPAQVIFLQNHGVFVGGNSEGEITAEYHKIMGSLQEHYQQRGVALEVAEKSLTPAAAMEFGPVLRGLLAVDGKPMAVTAVPEFTVAAGPLTPDHIVYAKSFALTCASPDAAAIADFAGKRGYNPLVVAVPGKAVFCAGKTYHDAQIVAALAHDAALVQQFAGAFGGVHYLSDAQRGFIENWEVESYRRKVAAGAGGRLLGKVAVVTGGAQGFGYGIAEELAAAGASVVIADLNLDGAKAAAERLNAGTGKLRSFAVAVNVADESSVAAMVDTIVTQCGGIDIFVSNAGVLKAGSVKTLEFKDWKFVTDVNYTGYFLCVKHVASVMARQNAVSGGWTDIVQVNSKSGLVGSNKNGAYAGSKFGTIGLTQSFALELVRDRVKVNSVCPGNFFDGPLWSDPVKGLFVQYLNSGKVPGAKDVADVKKHYESQIPMRRGCFPKDVAQAIIYAVEQAYETGQAIPVTGGQVMLS